MAKRTEREKEYPIGTVVVFTHRKRQYKGYVNRYLWKWYDILLMDKVTIKRVPVERVKDSQLQINLFE